MNALNILSNLNINTTNRIRAVHDAGSLEFNPDQYREVIGQLTNSDDVNVSDDTAKHTLMYLVQDIVTGVDVNIETARDRAESFISKNKWVLAKSENPSYYVPKSTVDALGQPKQKKGAKKVAAIKFWKDNKGKFETRKEWIQALSQYVGLTPAAASTYYHNLKTGQYK